MLELLSKSPANKIQNVSMRFFCVGLVRDMSCFQAYPLPVRQAIY